MHAATVPDWAARDEGARAHQLHEWASAAIERSEQLVADSKALCDRGEESRSAVRDAGWPRYFHVRGEVEGLPVRAAWHRGKLWASRSLLTRASLLVSLREQFTLTDTGSLVDAGLDEATSALLTCVRSCDRIRRVDIGPIRRAG